MEGLNDIKELWAMTNAILVVIAMATILLGYWFTQQPQPVPVRARLGQIKRRADRDFTVIFSGVVQQDKQSYTDGKWSYLLPPGASIPFGKEVALVMFHAKEGR